MAISKQFLKYLSETPKTTVELYVEGLGWLVLLTENIEIVSDNWFASTKFNKSSYETVEGDDVIYFTNVYIKNSSFIENANNVKYNLQFDHLYLNADKITAFH